MCIHCSLHKQKCRLKSTTTDGWRRFGQSEQPKSSELFPIQSEKSPDSGFFACDLWKKCIMPSSRKQITEIKGEGMIAGYLLPPLKYITWLLLEVCYHYPFKCLGKEKWSNTCCLRVILFSYPPTLIDKMLDPPKNFFLLGINPFRNWHLFLKTLRNIILLYLFCALKKIVQCYFFLSKKVSKTLYRKKIASIISLLIIM